MRHFEAASRDEVISNVTYSQSHTCSVLPTAHLCSLQLLTLLLHFVLIYYIISCHILIYIQFYSSIAQQLFNNITLMQDNQACGRGRGALIVAQKTNQ